MSLTLSFIVVPIFAEAFKLGSLRGIESHANFVTNNTEALQCSCPDTRSILDIIWSCLATVFLCTWVSVHPNLGPPKELKLMSFFRRVKVMFWGLLGPDIILFWSMAQWFAARNIAKKYADRGWTMTHGFFLGMGGFALFKGEENLGTLTKEMFEELEASGDLVFPTITRDDIEDKSKGDPLTKALVVLQTLWFITQSIARGVAGLAVTELEILTLAFCGLNGLMYFFWWYKPLDVQCHVPVYLKPESTYTIARPVRRARAINPEDPETADALRDALDPGQQKAPAKQSELSQMYASARVSLEALRVKLSLAFFELRIEIRDTFSGFRSMGSRGCGKATLTAITLLGLVVLFIIALPILCIPLVLFLIIYPSGWMTFKMIDIISVGDPFVMMTTEGGEIVPRHIPPPDLPVSERDQTFYTPVLREDPLNQMFIIYSLFGLAGGLFGGIHCIAWNFHFPTRADLFIWRTISLYLTAAPVLYSLLEIVDPIQEGPTETEEEGSFGSRCRTYCKLKAIQAYNLLYDIVEVVFY
ncbi:hypothetical protein CPC08DRAFT_660917, partial [Agrocybe pediades]